jgi:cytidylate kinase
MSEPAISKLAEQRMRQWAIGLEVKQRIAQEEAVKQLPEQVYPYVAISRDTGAGAAEIAQQVGNMLGWEVLNRELLGYMAEQYHLQKRMVEFVDETTVSWLLDTFGKWFERQVVTESEYITHLGHIVLLAAQHHSTVFVGRGAQFFLPRDRGVAIQIVAPKRQRIERVMRRGGRSHDETQRYLD